MLWFVVDYGAEVTFIFPEDVEVRVLLPLLVVQVEVVYVKEDVSGSRI